MYKYIIILLIVLIAIYICNKYITNKENFETYKEINYKIKSKVPCANNYCPYLVRTDKGMDMAFKENNDDDIRSLNNI